MRFQFFWKTKVSVFLISDIFRILQRDYLSQTFTLVSNHGFGEKPKQITRFRYSKVIFLNSCEWQPVVSFAYLLKKVGYPNLRKKQDFIYPAQLREYGEPVDGFCP
jgi:hypothetical protein